MPRSAAAIQAEITALEAQLPNLIAAQSYEVGGQKKTNQAFKDITQRLDTLYLQLGRATGSDPILVRGRVTGLGNNVTDSV